jgi:hypothetical protein
MSEPNPAEIRVQSGEAVVARSGTVQAIQSAVEVVGGPATIVGVAKFAKDIAVAKINANAQVKIAEITGNATGQLGQGQQHTE